MTTESFPRRIRALIGDEPLSCDTLGRSEARVLYNDRVFLKIGPAGTLKRAALMQEVFEKIGFSCPLLGYESDETRDYLLLPRMRGLDATHWRDDPKRLSTLMGEAVRALHGTKCPCPFDDVNERAAAAFEKETNQTAPDISPLKKDVLVHGDCCLPNLFFDEKGFVGFIDLGDAGIGDRHHDLYWGCWSLRYNLGTDRWNDRFLDAYGRDALDDDLMALCRKLYET